MEDEKMELMKRAETYSVTKSVESALNLPAMPNGKSNDELINEALNNEQEPDKKEKKRIKKRFKNIWNDYRSNVFGNLDAKNYADYCEIRKKTAETEKQLLEIEFETEKLKAKHWLEMNKGNLEEIGYNTLSLPNKFWYGLNRGLHYMKKTCSNIPSITWKILVGVLGIGAVILLAFGLAKII